MALLAPSPPSTVTLLRWGRRLPRLLGWGAALALLLSTELLFQPFIWRNFSLDEIAAGWSGFARDRLVVGLTVALALAPAGPWRSLPGTLRFTPYVIAVVAGALAGEALLSGLSSGDERRDGVALVGRVLRWSLVGGALAVMVALWRSGAELAAAGARARREAADARRLAASSEMERLRRQIEPHFLFNTLATIRRLHATDPAEGGRVLQRLLEFMGATLGEAGDAASTLDREVRLVCAYLDVCAARMSGGLTVRVEVEAGLEAMPFPPLVLATLAENTVKHGLFPRNGGEVAISARRVADEVEVALADDGVGLGDGEGGHGIGLANIGERLRLLYGPRAEFVLQANTPRGVRAVLRLPGPAG